MSTNINFNKKLGITSRSSSITLSSKELGFDNTSWNLDGQDDYLRNTVSYTTFGADSGNGANVKWSVCFWIKPLGSLGNQNIFTLLDIRTVSNGPILKVGILTDGSIKAFLNGFSNTDQTAAGGASLNNWSFISIVYDGTLTATNRLKAYVDADRTGATTSSVNANHAASGIIGLGAGFEMGGVVGNFEGHINEPAIWYGTALSQSQLEDIYNSGGPALDLEDITGVPSPTNWFRSENAVWSGPDPGGVHYLMDDEMGTANKIRTNNMLQTSRSQNVPI